MESICMQDSLETLQQWKNKNWKHKPRNPEEIVNEKGALNPFKIQTTHKIECIATVDKDKLTIWAWRREQRGSLVKIAVHISHILLLLLLPLPSLVVLKPVKHVLPFDMTVGLKPASYLLYLLCARRPYPLHVQALKHADLLLRGIPPGASRSPPADVVTLHFLRPSKLQTPLIPQSEIDFYWLFFFAWLLYYII